MNAIFAFAQHLIGLGLFQAYGKQRRAFRRPIQSWSRATDCFPGSHEPELSGLTPVSASGALPYPKQLRSTAASLLPPIASVSAMVQRAFSSEVLQRPFATR